MKSLRLTSIAVLTLGLAFGCTRAADATSTLFFNANQTYTGISSSPFSGLGSLTVENFENGSINSLMTAVGGSIRGPGPGTDSVDGDDGSVDGSGSGGHSFSTNGRRMTFRFSGAQGGVRPTMAGLAWTDGRPNSTVTFRAWDANGNLLGRIRERVGEAGRNGGTAEDRFFGIMSEEGVARITISSNRRGFEVDHVQFGFAYAFSAVPVPPALGLGLAGLAGLGLWKRLRQRRRS
jgi:hypothetical protein